MTHGPTRIISKDACIYCGARGGRLTDEHVVPYSLGGSHILEKASCDACSDITKKFEQDVARGMWGDARTSYGAPTQRKKERKSHIVLRDADNPSKSVRVPYSDYPAPLIFYKMSKAGLLLGAPEILDISGRWTFSAVMDDGKAKAFEQKYGIKLTAAFRHMPQSFGRMLAKIGYCNILTMLDVGDFRAICLPYILGQRPNVSYIVGSSVEDHDSSKEFGYVLESAMFGTPLHLVIVAVIRLFANAHSPIYHVIVGDVQGAGNVQRVLEKMGEGELSLWDAEARGWPEKHYLPAVWPLPSWA